MGRRPRLFVTFANPVPTRRCPRCAQSCDRATGLALDRPARPRPGNLTCCVGCRTWLAFERDLGLRVATADEVARIPDNLRALAERIATEWPLKGSPH